MEEFCSRHGDCVLKGGEGGQEGGKVMNRRRKSTRSKSKTILCIQRNDDNTSNDPDET